MSQYSFMTKNDLIFLQQSIIRESAEIEGSEPFDEAVYNTCMERIYEINREIENREQDSDDEHD